MHFNRPCSHQSKTVLFFVCFDCRSRLVSIDDFPNNLSIRLSVSFRTVSLKSPREKKSYSTGSLLLWASKIMYLKYYKHLHQLQLLYLIFPTKVYLLGKIGNFFNLLIDNFLVQTLPCKETLIWVLFSYENMKRNP